MWRKSTFSGAGGCVEVNITPSGHVLVRDTKEQTIGVQLRFTPAEWLAFLAGVNNHEFDL